MRTHIAALRHEGPGGFLSEHQGSGALTPQLPPTTAF